MKRFPTSVRSFVRWFAVAALLAATSAQALVLTAADLTQPGRLSRNGLAQDWVNSEPFPGVINTTSSYHFHAYSVNVGNTPFIQIAVDALSTNLFFSAYQSAYYPTSLQTNWLGDPGNSGNFFNGTDTEFFQVVAALGSELIIVVNETLTNAGLDAPFTFLVEGFTDSAYSNGTTLAVSAVATVIPEPPTIALIVMPLAALAIVRRRRAAGVVALSGTRTAG